jgi:hypothetical protein
LISRARYSPPINNENCAEPCDAFRQPCFGTMSTVLPRLNSSPMPIIRRLLTRRSCLCCLRCVRHSLHSDAEATVSTPSNIGVCPCTSKLCPATTLLTVRYTPCRPPSPSSISLDPHAPGSIYNLFVDIRTYIYKTVHPTLCSVFLISWAECGTSHTVRPLHLPYLSNFTTPGTPLSPTSASASALPITDADILD